MPRIIWPPRRFEGREGFLMAQFAEVFRFWISIGAFHDIFGDAEDILEAVHRCRSSRKKAKAMEALLRIAFGYKQAKDALSEALIDPEIGVFTAHFLKLFFGLLRKTAFQKLFPVQIICIDFDGIKKVNAITDDYDESDKLMAHGLDHLHRTVRICRRGRRRLPDLVCRYHERGDEFVVILFRCGSMKCGDVEERYQKALALCKGVMIRTAKGSTVRMYPRVTSVHCEMKDANENIGRILRGTFRRVLEKKKRAKRRRR